MTNDQIKKETEELYLQIENARFRLKELRTICNHEKTYQGNYSWRIGSYQLANICEYCGEMVSYVNDTFDL